MILFIRGQTTLWSYPASVDGLGAHSYYVNQTVSAGFDISVTCSMLLGRMLALCVQRAPFPLLWTIVAICFNVSSSVRALMTNLASRCPDVGSLSSYSQKVYLSFRGIGGPL